MQTRRGFSKRLLAAGTTLASGLAGSWFPVPARAGEKDLSTVEKSGGHYRQTWFLSSFLDMNEDLTMAAENGKRLAVIFELEGCPYCRETHLVNFADPEIRGYIRENFEMVQIDMKGSAEVTDFDGETLSESKLRKKWGIRFSPTIIFLGEPPAQGTAAGIKDLEVSRMQGYFRPNYFVSMFRYVREKAYESQAFPAYVKAQLAAGKS